MVLPSKQKMMKNDVLEGEGGVSGKVYKKVPNINLFIDYIIHYILI